jgi:hypothetical protein
MFDIHRSRDMIRSVSRSDAMKYRIADAYAGINMSGKKAKHVHSARDCLTVRKAARWADREVCPAFVSLPVS